jgi:hypothetical protein
MRTTALIGALVLASVAAGETPFTVDPTAGRNQFTAVFDAPAGERIVALSSAVGCAIVVDEAARRGKASCSVPLTAIRVDNDDTKTNHFRQWATNKKSDPAKCRLTVDLPQVVAPEGAAAGGPVTITTTGTFTVCGRQRDDGGAETIRITVAPVAPSQAGAPRLLRIRAHVDGFDRERYRVSPRHTDGWLARVQQLADVVASTGTIDVSLFATAPVH